MLELGRSPRDEQGRVHAGLECKARCAAHAFVDHERGAAAGVEEQSRPTRIRRDQRRLGRRQRHVVVAVREKAVDPKRADQPDRNANRADEVLDVALVRRPLQRCERASRSCSRAARREPGQLPARVDRQRASDAIRRPAPVARRRRAGKEARELLGVAAVDRNLKKSATRR